MLQTEVRTLYWPMMGTSWVDFNHTQVTTAPHRLQICTTEGNVAGLFDPTDETTIVDEEIKGYRAVIIVDDGFGMLCSLAV